MCACIDTNIETTEQCFLIRDESVYKTHFDGEINIIAKYIFKREI